jgi:DNA polymerase-3 subunit gamma/tau
MSYLALARKWRPTTFADVVGQPHIVRALTNALTSGRVHHAFLFAGTRGVGKTTVARILARCLNCETGVTATPCGKCRACVAIEEGRFVDLIEVDAASRTGIDDIRELLDNVQYTPASGRYKVYLVDEVHMLSKAAFNALLKTLEEPPPHVKFLFATTDPQRLPVTVLSRCLQFNLKRLPNSLLIERMERICEAEGVRAESPALTRIARAAAGSMRDALSLLDQALAFGNDALREGEVAEMLGTIDRSRVLALLERLVDGDAPSLLAAVRELDEFVPDYGGLLQDMAACLQQMAVVQVAGGESAEDDEQAPVLAALAGRLDPETTQLYYQVAIIGRRDLAHAPDPRTGFEMALLRMLAFHPSRPIQATVPQATGTPAAGGAAPPVPTAGGRPVASGSSACASAPERAMPRNADEWARLVKAVTLDGAVRQLAVHCELVGASGSRLRLRIDRANAHLVTEQLTGRLTAAVQSHLGGDVQLQIDVRDAATDTIAARDEQRQGEAVRQARQAIESDPNVRDLAALFGAEIVPESVKPVEPGRAGHDAD